MLNTGRQGHSALVTISSMNVLLGPFGSIVFNSAAAFPTANKVFYIPVIVPIPFLVQRMTTINGTVSGNVAMGVYTDNRGLPDQKVVDTGSTAQANANTEQRIDVTHRLLHPGIWWLALTASNTTGQYNRANTSALLLRMTGCMQETTGGFGLPATASPSVLVDAYMPCIGMRRMTN